MQQLCKYSHLPVFCLLILFYLKQTDKESSFAWSSIFKYFSISSKVQMLFSKFLPINTLKSLGNFLFSKGTISELKLEVSTRNDFRLWTLTQRNCNRFISLEFCVFGIWTKCRIKTLIKTWSFPYLGCKISNACR